MEGDAAVVRVERVGFGSGAAVEKAGAAGGLDLGLAGAESGLEALLGFGVPLGPRGAEEGGFAQPGGAVLVGCRLALVREEEQRNGENRKEECGQDFHFYCLSGFLRLVGVNNRMRRD